MDRLAAFLLLKRTVRAPAIRRRARVAECLMERLARAVGQPPDDWAMMGLLLFLDAEYAAHNDELDRGRVAREQAELDGLAPSLGASLERCWQPLAEPSALEHALRLADWATASSPDSDEATVSRLLGSSIPPGGSAASERVEESLAQLGLSCEQLRQILREAVDAAEARP